ncbi:MAG TPA: hypothetical protein VEL03_05595 [Streptosporangiaceae bacterium]|nr:hypothetical protein [Streptosporangiaceae bacterium]
MRRISRRIAVPAVAGLAAVALAGTSAAAQSWWQGPQPVSYSAATPALDSVAGGPWTTSQGDPTQGASYSPSLLFPTYTPGGATTTAGGITEPNLAVYPGASSGSGTPPYASGVAGTPGPVPGYCSSGGPNPESGTVNREPAGESLPMSPYYFPFVQREADGSLLGYFDYRPKDTDEAIVAARSTDGGKSWQFVGEALEQNPGYCPSGDTNDNGQGHPFVLDVRGRDLLYTVNRPTADTVGVGLLVHRLDQFGPDPLAGLPASQAVGVDPDTRAAATVAVSATPVTLPVRTLGTGPEQIGAPGAPLDFEDLSAASPAAQAITCTGTGTDSLTGCTSAAGVTVSAGDTLVEALSTVTTAVTIPQGPNDAAGMLGATVDITSPSASIASLFNANVAGRFYIDGATVYCVNVNGASTQLSDCTTTQVGGVTVSAGDLLTTDPIVPAHAGQTSGLVAPDGIVGTLRSYPGAPPGSTVIVYGEKILDYYAEATTTNAAALTLSSSTPITVPVTSTDYPAYAAGSDGSYTLQLGTGTKKSPGPAVAVTCTGEDATDFTGCTSIAGNGLTLAPGDLVGAQDACTAPYSTLSQIGEGGSSPLTLFKNNEDYTVLRAAYTYNGITFTDLGILGSPDASTDINDPAATAFPTTSGGGPANVAPGSAEPTELRFVGSRGSIIANRNGSYTMFLSGAWCGDGDSDSFNQIFYSTSADGVNWSPPVSLISTDYTFSAREEQDAALAGGQDEPLGISGYYSGRTYSPAVVQNPDGTLTMVFSGYSSPKPLPKDGTALGTGTTQWVVSATDPALYRDILTVTITPSS